MPEEVGIRLEGWREGAGTDGTAITAEAMCDLLRRDDPEADDYLAAVYGNAVRSVRRLAETAGTYALTSRA